MSQLREIQYRVLKHGTYARSGLPSFHTQNELGAPGTHIRSGIQPVPRSAASGTGFSYTALPVGHSRVYRPVMHGATGKSYTQIDVTTGGSYTSNSSNSLYLLLFSRRNCTKLSYTKHNNRADVFCWRKGRVP